MRIDKEIVPTARQRELLGWLAKGYMNTEIAQAMGIAPVTVKRHIQLLAVRYEARNRTHLVAIACTRGWLDGEA